MIAESIEAENYTRTLVKGRGECRLSASRNSRSIPTNPLFFHVAADAYLALMVAQGRDNTCPAAGRLNRALPSIPR